MMKTLNSNMEMVDVPEDDLLGRSLGLNKDVVKIAATLLVYSVVSRPLVSKNAGILQYGIENQARERLAGRKKETLEFSKVRTASTDHSGQEGDLIE
jgi:hypothetical protein